MTRKIAGPLFALFAAFATISSAQSTHAETSGTFSGEPTCFLTVSKRPSNLVRVDPQVDWGRFRSYRVLPATYQPIADRRPLSSSEALKVRATVDRSLQSNLKSTLADDGSVLEVRPIVTAVKRTNTLLNVLGFAAIQAPVSFGGATVHYELFDGQTGRQIGDVTLQRHARPWNVYPWNVLHNFEALGQASIILRSDSGRLRKDIDRLRKSQRQTLPAPAAEAE